MIDQIALSEDDLRNIDGQHVAGLSDEDVTAVISSNSEIRIFPSLLIDAFENVKILSLTNAMMSSFASPITKCDYLESIVIDRSELNDIPERVFERCGQLTSINFMNNNIMNIHENAATARPTTKQH